MGSFGVIIVCFVLFRTAASFSSWFANDFCTRPFVEGQIIMNYPVTLSSERWIQVFRDQEELSTGAAYTPGERLRVELSDESGQYVFEVSEGRFENGGCNGRREYHSRSILTTPDSAESISIWAGWAEDHGAVSITEKFLLHPASGYVRSVSSEEATLRRGGALLSKESEDTISVFSNVYVLVMMGVMFVVCVTVVYRHVYLTSASKKE